MGRWISGRAWTAALLAFALMAHGCSPAPTLTGTYVDERGETRYHFTDEGMVEITALDSMVIGEYVIDGDRVLVTSPQGTVVLKLRNGHLHGPMGMELVRVPSERERSN